jgi:monooxygenase
MTKEHFDVLIIGAGISGISAACHLQMHCPSKTFTMLEARTSIGGTWDLFRYPGVRSDSDMYTLGFSFRPWKNKKAIASGQEIHEYLSDTVKAHGLTDKLQFSCKVLAADWSDETSQWTLDYSKDGLPNKVICGLLVLCAGYYRYASGHQPTFTGVENFEGPIVHPQQWPESLEYKNKRIVVIGSGATAATLVPALAMTAAHVTMLQRSPSYFLARPSVDVLAQWMKRLLPERAASGLTRWKNILMGMYLFYASRKRPAAVSSYLLHLTKKQLDGVESFERHFTPKYAPWTQRLCLVPDNDLFDALRTKRASVVTDTIEHLSSHKIHLASGKALDADILVTATGLELEVAGGIAVSLNGQPVDFSKTLSYKGVMFSGIPNLLSVMGYLNASWTLKADLVARYLCRLVAHMDQQGLSECRPVISNTHAPEPPVDFSSGYFQRSMHLLPKQGQHPPWRLQQNYLKDLLLLRFAKVDDGVLNFRPRKSNAKPPSANVPGTGTEPVGIVD